MSRRIKLELNADSIDRAIEELNRYKKDVIEKTEKLKTLVADRIANDVEVGFSSSIASDIEGNTRKADVDVCINDSGTHTLVIARGEDAIFVEFGAGVYHNTPVGTSPHPRGADLHLTIGSYGQGKGEEDSWGYYEDGELYITHGTPATMPMYNAVKDICDDISQIAREVFK